MNDFLMVTACVPFRITTQFILFCESEKNLKKNIPTEPYNSMLRGFRDPRLLKYFSSILSILQYLGLIKLVRARWPKATKSSTARNMKTTSMNIGELMKLSLKVRRNLNVNKTFAGM